MVVATSLDDDFLVNERENRQVLDFVHIIRSIPVYNFK